MDKNKEVKLINLQDVKLEEIDWLLYPFIPYGKVTVLQGDPGEGKTTVMLRIIAALTTGRNIFDDSKGKSEKDPINVIYQTAEDGLGDTIKPRLLDAGADCSHVMVIDDSEKPLAIMDDRLETAISQTSAKLIVLDPIQGYIGAGVDMHRANEIRPLMKRLSNISERYRCAIVLIGHMNKCAAAKSNYRGLGSIDIQAAARSVLICARVRDDPEIRVICQIKSSLAPESLPIAFRLNANGFKWIGEYEITSEELLSGSKKGRKSKDAKEFLEHQLENGEKESRYILNEAEKQGIKKRTLMRVKSELGIESVKSNNTWQWRYPEEKKELR